MKRRGWQVALAAGGLGIVAYYLLPEYRFVVWSLLVFGSAAAAAAGAWIHKPNVRLPWVLITAGLTLFGIGDYLQYNVQGVGSDIADVCFLTTYVLMTIAMLAFVRARRRGRDIPALLDAIIITTGLAVMSWQFVMHPYLGDPSLTLDRKLTSIVLPLADVALVSVLVRLWSGGGHRRTAFYLLGGAVTMLLAADTSFAVIALQREYSPGGPTDAGLLAFAVGCGAAALHPSMSSLSQPGRRTLARLTEWRLMLLAGAGILAQVVLLLEWARGRPIEVPVVAGGSIVMIVLTGVRIRGITREITIGHERIRAVEQVQHASEQERVKLAADLHDGPVQELAVLSYTAHRVRKQLATGNLSRADEIIDDLERKLEVQVRALREIMAALRPPVLDNRGLAAALQAHLQQFEAEHGIASNLDINRRTDDLADEIETVIYRIVQEGLSNVRKHAQADQVWVILDASDDGNVRLCVRDNGVGFDAAQAAKLVGEGHYGLAGMRERVLFIGGDFTVQSSPGQGTTLEVTIPPRIPDLIAVD
jgi:signal transduction histidine kinase